MLFLSLRRYDPDQVRRVATPQRHLSPLPGAPLGRDDYPQSDRTPSRLRFAALRPDRTGLSWIAPMAGRGWR